MQLCKSFFFLFILSPLLLNACSNTSTKPSRAVASVQDDPCASVPEAKRRTDDQVGLVPFTVLKHIQRNAWGCEQGKWDFLHHHFMQAANDVFPRRPEDFAAAALIPFVGPMIPAMRSMGDAFANMAQGIARSVGHGQGADMLNTFYRAASLKTRQVLECYNWESQARYMCRGAAEVGSVVASFAVGAGGASASARSAQMSRAVSEGLSTVTAEQLGLEAANMARAEAAISRQALARIEATSAFEANEVGHAVHQLRLAVGNRRIVTLMGFSRRGYADRALFRQIIENLRQVFNPNETAVNLSLSKVGLGEAYPILQDQGFTTVGVSKAMAEAEIYGPCQIKVQINHPQYGGFDPQARALRPVSEAVTGATDELVVIGGGAISRDEAVTLALRGVRIRVFPMLDGEGGRSLAVDALTALRSGGPISPEVEAIMAAHGGRPRSFPNIQICQGASLASCR